MAQPTHTNIPAPVARAPQGRPEMLPAPLAPGAYPLAPPVMAAPPAGPPALTAAPNASTLLYAFRRRWLLALVVALVGAAATAGAVTFIVPGQYTAEALVKVAPPPQGEGNEPILDYRSYRDSQQGLLTSTTVLNAALDRPGVKDLPWVRSMVHPTGYLRANLKVDFNASPFLMRVTLSGDNPEELKALVNAVAETFVDDVAKTDKQRRKDLEDATNAQLEQTRKVIREKNQMLRVLRAQRGLPAPEEVKTDIDNNVRNINSLKDKLADLELKEAELESKIAVQENQIQNLGVKTIPDGVMEKYLQGDLAYQRLKEKLLIEEEKIEAYRSTAGSPAVFKANAQPAIDRMNGLLTQIKTYREMKKPQVREQVRIDLQDQVAVLKLDLTGLGRRKGLLEKDLKGAEAGLKRLRALEVMEDDPLMSDISLARNALKGLEDELAKIRKPSSPTITLAQRADTPQTLDRNRQLKLAGGAGVGMFVLLLLGVTLWEFRSRKINTSSEVVTGLGMELVGTLPALPARARQSAAANNPRDLHWQSVMAESIDSVRTQLLHAARAEHLQVVMVTSAVGGEGKTSLASQLAASLARAWKKTLLIDGDLRNPAVHKLFDQPVEPGFSEVLRGEVPLEDVIRPAPVSRLWVMSAGQWDAHAVQALAQDGVRSLFDGLKEQYDFIVVDSCPVLPVADSLSLGQHVDAVVFSILRDISRAPSVYAAQQRLGNLGVRILGAVVIGENSGAASYQYPSRGAK